MQSQSTNQSVRVETGHSDMIVSLSPTSYSHHSKLKLEAKVTNNNYYLFIYFSMTLN